MSLFKKLFLILLLILIFEYLLIYYLYNRSISMDNLLNIINQIGECYALPH